MKLFNVLPRHLSFTSNNNKKDITNSTGIKIKNGRSRLCQSLVSTLTIVALAVSFNSYGQKPPPSSVLHDFAVNTYRQFNYGNGNLRAMLTYGLSKHGYGPFDVALGIEELEKNKKFQGHVFEVLYNGLYGDEEFMKVNFLQMGMKASNSEILARYIINKYAVKSQSDQAPKQPIPPVKREISKDTFIGKSSGPKYVYPGSK